MTTPTAPQTKLDAVNRMLASIGQTPLNSLDTTGIRDAAIAELSLDTELRNVLLRGWQFNTDKEYPLTPNASDRVLVPATALFIDPTYSTKNYVMRWNDDESAMCLYDKENRTFTIDETVDVDVIWGYEFEQCPEHVRNYVTTKAARVFQSQVIGSDILFKYTQQHEDEAHATLVLIETRGQDRNMLLDSYDSRAIYSRQRNPRRFF